MNFFGNKKNINESSLLFPALSENENIIKTTFDFREFYNSYQKIYEMLFKLNTLRVDKKICNEEEARKIDDLIKNNSQYEIMFINRCAEKYGLKKLYENSIYFVSFTEECQRYIDSLTEQILSQLTPEKQRLFCKTYNVLPNFDSMNGTEFEQFCADVLLKNNFKSISLTEHSGDHGTDILAEKDDIIYAIQCKCYSSNIGNSAVQQALAGKNYYKADIAVVLTNRYFTEQAKEEAKIFNVKLWDRNRLLLLCNAQKDCANKTNIVVPPSNKKYDPLFKEVGYFCIEKNKGSIGMIQRAFKLGFERASLILSQLEEAGVIEKENGIMPRLILMSMEQFIKFISDNIK